MTQDRFLTLEFHISPLFCPRIVTFLWGQQELEAVWFTHRGKAHLHNQQEQMPGPNVVSASFCCCLQCMLLCGPGNWTSLTCTKIHPLLYACVHIISFGHVWMDCASLWVSCHEFPWHSVRISCARERFIRVGSSLSVNLGPGGWQQVPFVLNPSLVTRISPGPERNSGALCPLTGCSFQHWRYTHTSMFQVFKS
jgi:hypothetical protein